MIDLVQIIPRQVGHTTAICKAAKEIGAVVVAGNKQMANFIKDRHGVDAISVDELNFYHGNRRPLLFDNTAVEAVQYSERKDLRKEIKQLEEDVKTWMDNAKTYDKARMKEMEKRDKAVAEAEKLQKEISRIKKMFAPGDLL